MAMLFCLTANAAIDTKKAENFVKDLTQQGIEQLVNANVSEAEKNARFTKLFNEDLDLDFIGKFVLGRYWRTATPQQRADFIDVYRKLNIQTWSARFNEFKGKGQFTKQEYYPILLSQLITLYFHCKLSFPIVDVDFNDINSGIPYNH